MRSAVVESAPGVLVNSAPSRLRDKAKDFLLLTKPRIVLLFGVTGIAAMLVEGSLRNDPLRMFVVFLGMLLTAGSANAFNQYIDRDIDALMERTRKKRPIPAGRLSPQSALIFALATGTIATAMLYVYGNALAAFWGVFTIGFYIGVYTLWLKRMTPYNIVIGGAAGATAPLIGWAAATGEVGIAAWIMFAIIFMWTPPHFWALALCLKDEYATASVPMYPVVKGEKATRRQILAYTITLLPLSVSLAWVGSVGWFYTASAAALSLIFLKFALDLSKKKDVKTAWKTFGYSILYLLVLFSVMIVDVWVR